MHTSSWCLRYRRAVPLPAKVPLLRTGTYPVPESVQYSTAVVVLEWALLEVRFKPAPFPKTGKDAAPESIPLVRCTYTAKSLAANTRQGCTMVVTIPVAKLEFGVVNRHYIPQRKGAPMKLMTKKLNGVCLLALAMTFIACSKSAPPSQPAVQPQATTTPPPATSTASPTAEAPSAAARAVKTEMRNVNFHLTNKAAARIDTLSGEIWPTGKNDMPVFDDKASFQVRVANGKISMSPEGLADILNTYVFVRDDAPLKDLSVSIDKDRLVIKGKLHSKGDVPFQTAGTLSTTDDGRIRMHSEKMKAFKVPVKGMMGIFGIELANVLNTSKVDGLDTDKNDLLMDLEQLLPPPHLKGKVTGVRLENNMIVTSFGDGGKSAPPATEKGNYMTFQGGPVRFGKLLMENADLTVLDLDPGDPLDWNQDRYKDQLVAGYSKITPAFGLRAYVKDFGKLGRALETALPKP
jgi:hypothetical protein